MTGSMTISPAENGMAVMRRSCHRCGAPLEVFAPAAEFRAWLERRKPIHEAMPSLTADEREQCISGTCAACWEWLFGSDDDDE